MHGVLRLEVMISQHINKIYNIIKCLRYPLDAFCKFVHLLACLHSLQINECPLCVLAAAKAKPSLPHKNTTFDSNHEDVVVLDFVKSLSRYI